MWQQGPSQQSCLDWKQTASTVVGRPVYSLSSGGHEPSWPLLTESNVDMHSYIETQTLTGIHFLKKPAGCRNLLVALSFLLCHYSGQEGCKKKVG